MTKNEIALQLALAAIEEKIPYYECDANEERGKELADFYNGILENLKD